MHIERFPHNPIITPRMDSRTGDNINGPSLIRVPEWLPNPLAKYYLYFAHHQGTCIRMAYADHLQGPWTVYSPGTLQLAQTPCRNHIASPDVHIDHTNQRIIMYYHGPVDPEQVTIHPALTEQYPIVGGQRSFWAASRDGLHFTSDREVLGSGYFRGFRVQDNVYALGMPGIFYRSVHGRTRFEPGPALFTRDMRHSAVLVQGDLLRVFYSNAHDCPERILMSTIDLGADWAQWSPSEAITVLEPETEYEGVHLPLLPSDRGWAPKPVRQLRDPGIYCEDGRTYLLYSVAGEQGIAIAEITW